MPGLLGNDRSSSRCKNLSVQFSYRLAVISRTFSFAASQTVSSSRSMESAQLQGPKYPQEESWNCRHCGMPNSVSLHKCSVCSELRPNYTESQYLEPNLCSERNIGLQSVLNSGNSSYQTDMTGSSFSAMFPSSKRSQQDSSSSSGSKNSYPMLSQPPHSASLPEQNFTSIGSGSHLGPGYTLIGGTNLQQEFGMKAQEDSGISQTYGSFLSSSSSEIYGKMGAYGANPLINTFDTPNSLGSHHSFNLEGSAKPGSEWSAGMEQAAYDYNFFPGQQPVTAPPPHPSEFAGVNAADWSLEAAHGMLPTYNDKGACQPHGPSPTLISNTSSNEEERHNGGRKRQRNDRQTENASKSKKAEKRVHASESNQSVYLIIDPETGENKTNEIKIRETLPSADGRYSCEDCGKSFKSRSDLISHARTHTGEKPLTCKECGKKFAHSSNLRSHERTHTGEKRYACTWPGCDRKFAHPASRDDHIATHSGHRRHICPVCHRGFTAKANLTRHRRDVHGET